MAVRSCKQLFANEQQFTLAAEKSFRIESYECAFTFYFQQNILQQSSGVDG